MKEREKQKGERWGSKWTRGEEGCPGPTQDGPWKKLWKKLQAFHYNWHITLVVVVTAAVVTIIIRHLTANQKQLQKLILSTEWASLTWLHHVYMLMLLIISRKVVALFLICSTSSSSSFWLKTALIPFSPTTTGRLRNTSSSIPW